MKPPQRGLPETGDTTMAKLSDSTDAQVETETENTQVSADTATGDTPPAESETEPADEVQKWRALSRKYEERAKANEERAKANEARAKANEAKAKRLDEIEEASKTEAQKAAEEMDRLRKENTELKVQSMRERVARESNVPLALLTADSEDALAAQVEAIRAEINAQQPKTPAAPPADSLGERGGSVHKGVEQITSRAELKSMSPEQVMKAMKEGRLKDLMGEESK